MSIQCNKTGEMHVTGAMTVIHNPTCMFILSPPELWFKILEIRRASPIFMPLIIDRKIFG
jgi:hypothetical protein